MSAFDRAVAILVLTATLGWLALRAFRARADFRLQRRYVDLLARSVTELEESTPERHG